MACKKSSSKDSAGTLKAANAVVGIQQLISVLLRLAVTVVKNR